MYCFHNLCPSIIEVLIAIRIDMLLSDVLDSSKCYRCSRYPRYDSNTTHSILPRGSDWEDDTTLTRGNVKFPSSIRIDANFKEYIDGSRRYWYLSSDAYYFLQCILRIVLSDVWHHSSRQNPWTSVISCKSHSQLTHISLSETFRESERTMHEKRSHHFPTCWGQ